MITYRRATAIDVPSLRVMLQALSDHDGGTYAVASEQSLRDHGFGIRPLFQAAIAEHDGAGVGMVIYYPDYSTHRGEAGVYVQDIYVSDAARGAGVGRGLLAFMLQTQAWDARYITLGASPDNATANRFYSRLGFSARGYQVMILADDALATLKTAAWS